MYEGVEPCGEGEDVACEDEEHMDDQASERAGAQPAEQGAKGVETTECR
jgi:hypothetical protein